MNIKFTLVAAASMIATALPAQVAPIPVTGSTSISISGLLAVGMKNDVISQGNAATGRTLPSESHLDDNTSRLIISSTSKIADGWNVLMRVESRFTTNVRPGEGLITGSGAPAAYSTYHTNDASGWADGDTWGGISSPYGTITAGKSTLYYSDTISAGYLGAAAEQPGESYRIWDANGLATFNLLSTFNVGSVAGGVLTPTNAQILGNTRSRNVIRYDSIMFQPDAASLLNFSLAWTKNAAGAQNTVWPTAPANGSTYEGGETVYGKVLYNGHGVSASFSYLDQKFQGVLANAFDTELKAWRLGASYKVEGFKIGVVVDRSDMVNGLITAGVLSDAKRTVFSVPASYSFGDHAVYATYTKAGNTSSLSDTGANQLNLVYDYALTKRAFVGVFYTKIQNDTHGYYSPFLAGYSAFGGSQIATGESWRQIGVNLNYWF